MPHHTIFLYACLSALVLLIFASVRVSQCIRYDNKIKFEEWERD
jgi:hypothetical protein